MKYVLPLCILAIILSACSCNAPLPDIGEGREEALGSITVSSLAFTPLDTYSDGNRLNYGAMKDEASIRNMIHAASLGISVSEFRSFQADFEARGNILGVDATKIIAKGTDEPNIDTEEETITETITTPDNAGDGFGSARDPKLQQPSFGEGEFHLSPDEQISLIAAYKMMMVNLEQYYNADSFVNVENKDAKYLPYRVHFTVSMQPGWWARAQHWEPVIKIKLGSSEEECRILNVTPAETAQTLTQQFSSLKALSLGARIGASYGPVAADAAVNYINEKTRKLEGIRNNKTAIVGFPDSDTVSIRFRPNYVPDKRFRDLQPVSRVFTATVLVRSDWNKNAGSTCEVVVSTNDYDDGPTKALFGGKTEVETEATDIRLSLITESRRLKYTVSSQFEPAMEEEANRTNKPELDGAPSLNGIRTCYKRTPSGNSDCECEKDERYTLVPIWNTESKKPFAILKTLQNQQGVEGIFYKNAYGRYSAIVSANLSKPRYIVQKWELQKGKLQYTRIAWRFVDANASPYEKAASKAIRLQIKSKSAQVALTGATGERSKATGELTNASAKATRARAAATAAPAGDAKIELGKTANKAEDDELDALRKARDAYEKEAKAITTASKAIESEAQANALAAGIAASNNAVISATLAASPAVTECKDARTHSTSAQESITQNSIAEFDKQAISLSSSLSG
ncbi:MAG: hypothetical protein V3V10_08485 [Planctomycetota bacterium]